MAEETVPQMRARIEEQNKELSELRRAVQEKDGAIRRFEAREVFREAGLPAQHADLYTAANPEGEITKDGILEFANAYNLAPQAESEPEPAEEATEETASDPGSGLEAFSGGGSRGGSEAAATPRPNKLTKEEWYDLQKTDPAAAKARLLAGEVELNPDNPYVRQGQYPG